jgi:prepilin-type N-terminal cleavage/methylation domain-containing protein
MTGPTGRRQGITAALTLPELLVVLAILALVATAVVPALGRMRRGARLELCQSRIGEVGKACLQFEANGVGGADEAYVTGLAAQKNVLPWRNLRAIQHSEDLPPQWADPLCVRKLTVFVTEEGGTTPVSTVQGLGRLFPALVGDPAGLYCPAATVWTRETGWPAADGSAYVTYCSREGGYQTAEGRALFNTYTSGRAIAFLSCASFMGYDPHGGGWNVWYTDGRAQFVADPNDMLNDLSVEEWFDMPPQYPPAGRWSIWRHFDELQGRGGDRKSPEPGSTP